MNLSVFLENREGRLEEVLDVLAKKGVNIVALSLADTSDYGMLRLIVSDPHKGRAALKEAGDYQALALLPRNSSPVRLHNRCMITGRPRGYMRQFGISRVLFRKMALEGKIAGVTKASW